jgi:hypothetical protein
MDPDTGVGSLMPPEWQCLTTPDVRPMQPAATGGMPPRVSYVVPIVDFYTQPGTTPLEVPGVRVTACENPACSVPTTPQVFVQRVPDSPILWGISVPWGFEISLRVEAEGYVPSDYYPGGGIVGVPPDGGMQMVAQPITMLRTEALATLYTQIGLPSVDPAKGILAVRTLNCDRDMRGTSLRAEGVRIELVSGSPPQPAPPPEDAVPWVLTTGSAATNDSDVGTDLRGAAGFANLLPQTYRVRGIAPAPVGSDEGTPYAVASGAVRPGVITVVEARDGWGVWGQ